MVPIDIPPLRERKEDIPELVTHFLERYARDNGKAIRGITPAALEKLAAYHWPGNVRQLENTIERAVALSHVSSKNAATQEASTQNASTQSQGGSAQSASAQDGALLDVNDIYLDAGQPKPASGTGNAFLPEGMTLEQWEDEMVREALRRANGNKSQAARLLGLSRNALRYRLSKLGVPDEGE